MVALLAASIWLVEAMDNPNMKNRHAQKKLPSAYPTFNSFDVINSRLYNIVFPSNRGLLDKKVSFHSHQK